MQISLRIDVDMNKDVFITCAVTGAGNAHRKSSKVPVTPKQIAEAVAEAASAGAAIAHIHVRDPETGEGSRDVGLYRQVLEHVRSIGTDIIINLTAGMGGDLIIGSSDPLQYEPGTDLVGFLERLAHVEELLPDICTLDCGSYNVGRGNLVYISTSEQIRAGAERIGQLGVKPELEVFDTGHLRFALELIKDGAFKAPVLMQFCLGVPYGAPATPSLMLTMRDMLTSDNVIWSGFGVGRTQIPMAAQALLLGGNVRVGLEDNIYLDKGVFATNGELVERAVTIIETLGARVMTPAETRRKLGLVTRGS